LRMRVRWAGSSELANETALEHDDLTKASRACRLRAATVARRPQVARVTSRVGPESRALTVHGPAAGCGNVACV